MFRLYSDFLINDSSKSDIFALHFVIPAMVVDAGFEPWPLCSYCYYDWEPTFVERIMIAKFFKEKHTSV